MNLMQIMEARYSCRRFNDKPITDHELTTILEAGRIAPSAVNKQPWRCLVVQNEAGLANVDACTKCRYGASTVILVCFDSNVSAKNPAVTPDYGWIDSGLALMQMVLEAEYLGIDSCIVGAYDPDVARRVFNMPDYMVPYQFLMLGHSATEPAHRHYERHSLADIVFHETF